MATYNHPQLNQQAGHGAAGKQVVDHVAAAASAGGTITSVTMTALPDTSDIVEVCDGPDVVAELTFNKNDTGRLNVAQTVKDRLGGTSPRYGLRGLTLKAWSDGGKSGAYTLTYS